MQDLITCVPKRLGWKSYKIHPALPPIFTFPFSSLSARAASIDMNPMQDSLWHGESTGPNRSLQPILPTSTTMANARIEEYASSAAVFGPNAPGPTTRDAIVPRRPRRGGRRRKDVVRKPPYALIDPATRRQNTAVVRQLGACLRCHQKKIPCHVNPLDVFGRCLTCAFPDIQCLRPGVDKRASLLIPQPMLDKQDAYVAAVETFDLRNFRSRKWRVKLKKSDGREYFRDQFTQDTLIRMAMAYELVNSDNITRGAITLAYEYAYNQQANKEGSLFKLVLYIWLVVRGPRDSFALSDYDALGLVAQLNELLTVNDAQSISAFYLALFVLLQPFQESRWMGRYYWSALVPVFETCRTLKSGPSSHLRIQDLADMLRSQLHGFLQLYME
ncbi:hypothetical protein BU26DRAFT_333142 [Trematosphaeria pertusa]|uniref:Zn(2)-C6 fungal-type domain-containing protein n=1 Tax=Trematosphaeria pertusa TaxID=390896 RepID=A0A6A6IFT6_9PLEO|nr:uncharacterized protein BU26DRAFT_333142 [Trematosphaeria pertusa]KAF2248390.1 hypothetical protein BU26DRAFT_333142 [Trematosphaeria pertusa]